MPPRVPNGSPGSCCVLREIVGDAEVVDASETAAACRRARRLIFCAADRYRSISVGDIFSTPAMLSNP